jgi:hypothetical protein
MPTSCAITPPRSTSPRKAHIGDVIGAQVDFRRAAGAFDQHQIGLRLQSRKTLQHRRHQLRFEGRIVPRAQGRDAFAMHDDLRADIGLGLEQYRVHVGMRLDTCGVRLQGLGTADLAAVDCHRGIVRHVLRLERQHPQAAVFCCARKAGDDERLAYVRARPLDHQCARHGRKAKTRRPAAP